MAKITTYELPKSLQTLFLEVERTKTPLTIIHEGKPLAIVYPATTETKRPPSDVLKGNGEILGDIVAPAAEDIPPSSNRLASLGQDRGKFIVPDDFNEP
ncbi:MAG: type II toxin-antitoxin system Phd/YefM family antitoxin [Okeania sp. SIO2D1]|nr:type II toxin-antitoxin system Phd/YefM family antitoxin [Okeania sp. SIO2D1]